MSQIKNLDDLQYILMPGKMPFRCSYVEEYNRVFDFWDNLWTPIFKEIGEPEKQWRDHYQRQDIIAALLTADQVVGCHLYTFYSLESHATYKSEYFSRIPGVAIEKTKNLGLMKTMSMEYLCVDPSWKFNSGRIPINRLIISLGNAVANSFGADASLGMPFTGNSASRSGDQLGFKVIHEPVFKANHTLSYVYYDTRSPISVTDPGLAHFFNSLWNNRIAHVNHAHSINEKKLNAA